jgi:hypothetical protein
VCFDDQYCWECLIDRVVCSLVCEIESLAIQTWFKCFQGEIYYQFCVIYWIIYKISNSVILKTSISNLKERKIEEEYRMFQKMCELQHFVHQININIVTNSQGSISRWKFITPQSSIHNCWLQLVNLLVFSHTYNFYWLSNTTHRLHFESRYTTVNYNQ